MLPDWFWGINRKLAKSINERLGNVMDTTKKLPFRKLSCVLATSVLLAACGSSNNSPTAGTPTPPAKKVVKANDDSASNIDGSAGASAVVNVLSNDTLDGAAATTSNVSLSETTADSKGVLTLNSDGSVDVKASSAAGTYTLTYQICEAANGSNCDSGTVSVEVVRKTVVATNDTASATNDGSGGSVTVHVLRNDTFDGAAASVSNVDVSIVNVTAGLPPYNLRADGSITATIAPATAAGNYDFDYRICEKGDNSNCDTAKVSITVTTPAAIVATDDSVQNVDGQTGATGVLNVLSNDTLGGQAVNSNSVRLSEMTGVTGLTLNSDGSIDVAANIHNGSHVLTYRICEAAFPSNCAVADATIGVINSVQTGSFAGPKIVGLHYQTATQNGVTNADGEFIYEAGEEVTFSLNGHEIGKATPVNGRVDVYDLVGLDVPSSQRDVNRLALGGNNGQKLKKLDNILTRLMMLDADNDPTNGVDLGSYDSSVVVSTGNSFDDDNLVVFRAVNQIKAHANHGDIWDYEVCNIVNCLASARDLHRKQYTAMSSVDRYKRELFTDLNLNFAVNLHIQHDGAGKPTQLAGGTTLQYNSDGLLSKSVRSYFQYKDIFDFTYNSDEHLTKYVFQRQINNVSQGKQEVVFTLNAEGLRTKVETKYYDIQGTLTRTDRVDFTYDALNNPTRISSYYYVGNASQNSERRRTNTFDSKGRLTNGSNQGIYPNTPAANYTHPSVFTYFNNTKKLASYRVTTRDLNTWTYTYDAQTGLLTKTVHDRDFGNNGTIHRRTTITNTYDAQGKLTNALSESDTNADGSVESTTKNDYTYNSLGLLAKKVVEQASLGTPYERDTVTYTRDTDGFLTKKVGQYAYLTPGGFTSVITDDYTLNSAGDWTQHDQSRDNNGDGTIDQTNNYTRAYSHAVTKLAEYLALKI